MLEKELLRKEINLELEGEKAAQRRDRERGIDVEKGKYLELYNSDGLLQYISLKPF